MNRGSIAGQGVEPTPKESLKDATDSSRFLHCLGRLGQGAARQKNNHRELINSPQRRVGGI